MSCPVRSPLNSFLPDSTGEIILESNHSLRGFPSPHIRSVDADCDKVVQGGG